MADRALIEALAVTAQVTATRLTEAALDVMARHLEGFQRPVVLDALHRAGAEVRPGQFTLSAVMDRLDDGHPGPETAWAALEPLTDEDSIVWTEEMARAYGTVRELLTADRVAARMAFLEGYRRLLGEARRLRRAPVWMASLGFNAAGRVAALQAAVEAKRLPEAQARAMLPRHEWPHAWDQGRALPEGRADPAQVHALIAAVLEKKPGAQTAAP